MMMSGTSQATFNKLQMPTDISEKISSKSSKQRTAV
jgi:hypothetical protein